MKHHLFQTIAAGAMSLLYCAALAQAAPPMKDGKIYKNTIK